jgi:peptide/nickel transport system substrate-binding protein
MAKPTGPVKDTIVVSMGQAPDTLHPLIGSMLARTEVLGALFTYPVQSDNRGEWVAIGVEQVPTLENGGARFVGEGDDRHLEVTFKIREGVKWHDGVPTTSRDIKYAWELYMDPQFPATEREQASKVFAIDTPDERTAVVKYMSARQARDAAANGHRGLEKELWGAYTDQKEPLTDPLYFQLPQGQGEWLPEHILSKIPPEQHQASDWANKPIGNGPYKVVEVVPEQFIRLEAVPDYFRGAPPTKNLVFRIITDTNAALAALQAGEIDVATQVQGPEIDKSPELDRLQGYKAYYIPGTPWEHIDLNMDDPILKDKNVRKALIQAINRQQIVDALLFGKTRVATSWIQPGVPAWAYDESCVNKYSYDPAAAGRLLEQAGYTKGSDGVYQRDGQRLSLRLQTTDQALRRNVSQVIQQNLKDAGIQLELEFIPGRGLFAREGPLTQRTFQLGLYTWIANPDPDASTLYKSTSIPSPDNNFTGQNNPGFKNPQFDELMTRGANELSVDKRKQIYCEAQKIWTDELPVIPLFQRLVVTTARANLANYRPTPTLTPETWNSWAWFIPAS